MNDKKTIIEKKNFPGPRSFEKYAEPVPIIEPLAKVKSNIKIACILNDTTSKYLDYECELLYLDENNLGSILYTEKPILILLETIHMHDDWATDFYDKNSSFFDELFLYSKAYNIPIVLWETIKSNFFYKFSNNAVFKCFSHIFTAFEENMETYKNITGHDNIHYLPIGVQPRIFNPVNALSTPKSILEQIACGTAVPICNSEIKGNVSMLTLETFGEKKEISDIIDKLLLLGQREILSRNTYTHILDIILKKTGLSPLPSKEYGVTILTSTNRIDSMDNVFKNYEQQNIQNKELIVILNNNKMDLGEWRYRGEQYKNVKVFQVDEKFPLGRCLNLGVDNSSYNHISKFDDDNYYAPNFLSDLLNTYKYAHAEIVGKLSYYAYLEGCGVLAIMCPNMENKYVNMMSGSGLVIKKEVFEKVRFGDKPRGSDTVFLRACIDQGVRMYSADRFNYVYRRHASQDNHTWKIKDEVYLRSCKFVAFTEEFISRVTV